MSRMERRWGVEGLEYGFVYRWTDNGSSRPVGRPSSKTKKRQRRIRYYIGSHWGKFNDGYVCSSRAMNAARKRRPQDFTRRIIAVATTDRRDLLAAEQAALDKIPRSHFGTRAYNVSTKVHKPWWAKGSRLKNKTIVKLKASWQNADRRAAASLAAKQRKYSADTRDKMSRSAKKKWRDEEVRATYEASMKGRKPWNTGTKGLVQAWNKGTKQPPLCKSHRAKIAASLAGRKRSKEDREAISAGAIKRWESAEYRSKISASRAAARARGECKVTPKQAMRIRTLRSSKKYTLDTLGSKFGVSASYIHGVIHDAKWDSAIRALNT